MHTVTLAHMHTCRCSSSSWSFITRSAPVVKPSSSVSHICRLAWQPEGPHASRGETFAPLFVSQNNIISPIVFSSPPSRHPPPTVSQTPFAERWRVKHLARWFLILRKYAWTHVRPLLVTLCSILNCWSLKIIKQYHTRGSTTLFNIAGI